MFLKTVDILAYMLVLEEASVRPSCYRIIWNICDSVHCL